MLRSRPGRGAHTCGAPGPHPGADTAEHLRTIPGAVHTAGTQGVGGGGVAGCTYPLPDKALASGGASTPSLTEPSAHPTQPPSQGHIPEQDNTRAQERPGTQPQNGTTPAHREARQAASALLWTWPSPGSQTAQKGPPALPRDLRGWARVPPILKASHGGDTCAGCSAGLEDMQAGRPEASGQGHRHKRCE